MYKFFLKRVIDILISILAIPFIFITIILVGPIIYMNDKGPIFYNSERIGKNGKTFKMFKLRSMKVNAPDIRNNDGSTFNAETDERVTNVGKFIRKTSLDELPQFINVLLGDMSVIGPRPNLPTVKYDKLSELEKRRLDVKPGITGYNQAYYRNSVDTIEKYINDIYYLENLTFFMDIKIFLKTICSVVRRNNINIS
ncbi:sugar transferase [Peptostreptococcus equinus]|uniref:Sugar transferase n=1 Tax=Peptostreptococcus equinus TaxID=3003601 RepID=A0ABY7JQA5_9FIRM|nr:sugar transferase [Peptostreptococcus sp. CBA3647]WAW14160.1 sugar transferase [Peptostreptococcus sp. CBA3647]